MKFRWFIPVLLLFWQCASPPQAPQRERFDDDDHRSVSRADFAASGWRPVPGAVRWQAEPSGVTLQLADGREASLTFPAAGVVRWWVAPGPGEKPLSPAARYPDHGAAVTAQENGGVLALDTPDLSVRLRLADLSWTLIRGDTAVVHTAGGPRMAGRRLLQAFASADAAWFGPGLETDTSAKFWISNDPDTVGPWAAPLLFGLGAVPFAVVLDNSYQTYSRVTGSEASLGALNGGLDLLVAASPDPAAVLSSLTSITGRPPALPAWAVATAVALPAAETGAFIRQAGLAVGLASGAAADRQALQFRQIAADPAAVPADPTSPETRKTWPSWVPNGAGASLAPYAGSTLWAARFDDEGRNSLLARENNLIPAWEAQAVAENAASAIPITTPSAGPGASRWALAELTDRDSLQRALSLGLAGFGVPAFRVDVTGLAGADTKEAAFRQLLSRLMAPVLTLDWGPDPAAFWAALSDADKKRLKTILDVRSQFAPALALAARQASATGVPVWRPVWFANARGPQTASADEFLLGDLLVAPVAAGAAKRQVYLPGPGVWFDFWTDEEYGGGQSYDVDFKPDRPLLFARGGAFVATRDPQIFDNHDVDNPVTMHVFPGGRGQGTYYYDDGVSGGKPGTFFETRLLYDFAERDMTLEHQAVSAGTLRPEPYLLYRLHNVYRPRQVSIDGKPVPLYGPSWGVTDSDRSAAWYEDNRSLLIKTFRPEKSQTILMNF